MYSTWADRFNLLRCFVIYCPCMFQTITPSSAIVLPWLDWLFAAPIVNLLTTTFPQCIQVSHPVSLTSKTLQPESQTPLTHPIPSTPLNPHNSNNAFPRIVFPVNFLPALSPLRLKNWSPQIRHSVPPSPLTLNSDFSFGSLTNLSSLVTTSNMFLVSLIQIPWRPIRCLQRQFSTVREAPW